jgi:hypothetical protein
MDPSQEHPVGNGLPEKGLKGSGRVCGKLQAELALAQILAVGLKRCATRWWSKEKPPLIPLLPTKAGIARKSRAGPRPSVPDRASLTPRQSQRALTIGVALETRGLMFANQAPRRAGVMDGNGARRGHSEPTQNVP